MTPAANLQEASCAVEADIISHSVADMSERRRFDARNIAGRNASRTAFGLGADECTRSIPSATDTAPAPQIAPPVPVIPPMAGKSRAVLKLHRILPVLVSNARM